MSPVRLELTTPRLQSSTLSLSYHPPNSSGCFFVWQRTAIFAIFVEDIMRIYFCEIILNLDHHINGSWFWFKIFLSYSFGCFFVQGSGAISAILMEVIMRNISVKLFWIWTSGFSRGTICRGNYGVVIHRVILFHRFCSTLKLTFINQGSYRQVGVKFKGLLKTILQFSRTKRIGKILI